jgi:hypothetical protein
MNLPTLMSSGEHRDPGWRTRRSLMALLIAFAAVVAALVWLFLRVGDLTDQVHAEKAKVYAAVGAATSANASLSAANLPTIPINTSAAAPTATVTISGPQGDTGPGPSDAQVALAITGYCQNHTCGTPPTAQDVAAAVVAYCVSHGGCAGPAGAAGPSGSVGPSGASGQDASPQQIAAAVQSYCSANNGCQGPTGTTGPTGPAGPTGPEIPSFTFTVPGTRPGQSTTYVCQAPTYQCTAEPTPRRS